MIRKIRKILFVPIILLSLTHPILAQEVGIQFIENKPWQEILALSEKQDKPIFLDCYTSWCGPCNAMDQKVFPLKEVGSFMNSNFINVKLDMEKGEGIELYNQYREHIPGFPTFLIFNSKGEVLHQVVGYHRAEKFILKMKDGIKEIPSYATRYKPGQRDWNFLHSYLNLLEKVFQRSKIKEITREILPELTIEIISKDSFAYKIFKKYGNTTEGDIQLPVLSSSEIY